MSKMSLKEFCNILKNQIDINWQDIRPYGKYNNSFEAHAYKHPIGESYSPKWKSIIDYSNKNTIYNSYQRVSTRLPQRFILTPRREYELHYNQKHFSYNILDKNSGLMTCLKLWKKKFYIATCYFPSNKVINLFSKDEIITDVTEDFDINFMLNVDNVSYDVKNANAFKEAMKEFFGTQSTKYRILFENVTNDTELIIHDIVSDTNEYLSTMERIIKDEEDKKYYFVYDDGIEYIINLSLLYKLRNEDYEELYQRFLSIDVNDSYKNALDECKKYIDEGENKNGKNN